MKKAGMWIVLSVITALLLSGCSRSRSEGPGAENSEQETESIRPSETEKASVQIDFQGVDAEGNEISSAVFSEARLTMVNVWATYCNPCLSEMPGLGELAGEYDPKELQIIGIISDVEEGGSQEMTDLALDLIEQTGADYTHLLLNESVYNALLTDVTAVPTTFFVDESGVILDTVIGAMEKSAWEEKINALLEE